MIGDVTARNSGPARPLHHGPQACRRAERPDAANRRLASYGQHTYSDVLALIARPVDTQKSKLKCVQMA